MKFWDTSAILPLLFAEPTTSIVSDLYTRDPALTVWCLTEIEMASAISRRTREGLPATQATEVTESSRRLAARWTEVLALDAVRPRAMRLVNVHALRAGDVLQLAAAIVASGERPETLPFVCLDERLRDAARREGFPVLPA